MHEPRAAPAAGPGAWSDYYDKTGRRPPRETLMRALDAFAREPGGPRRAVDLGCGGGRDIAEMLRRGWTVLAIDAEATAIEQLTARDDLPSTGRLETRIGRFEDLDWPAAELVNSSFALPLCPPRAFPALWSRIVGSLGPGGRFAGQLYGDRDEWFGDPSITFHSAREVDVLLRGFEVEYLREEEDDSVTPRGRPKHWHIFHIVARKKV